MSFRTTMLAVCVAFSLVACAVSQGKQEESLSPMPEPLVGINVFVAADPVALPADGKPAVDVPNARRPIPFDYGADQATQQMVMQFSSAMREVIEPVFRTKIEQVRAFVAGAQYPWDELRRDRRNYALVILSQRAASDSQRIDVRAALLDDDSGNPVWRMSFRNPYGEPDPARTHQQRLTIVQELSEQMLADMSRKGILGSATGAASKRSGT